MTSRIMDRTCCASCGMLLLLGVGIIVPAQAQTPIASSFEQNNMRFVHWVYQDAVGLFQAAGPRMPLYAIGASATLVVLSPLDPGIGEEAPELRSGLLGGYLNVVNEVGGPRATAPVVGIAALSLVTDNERFQDAAFTSLESLIFTGGIVYALKYAIGRHRPYADDGAFQFSPFSGRSSLPSGHTATAFAVLTPWVLYYPHPVTYSLFAVATGTGVARLVREKHWATDVLAGGTIGFMTAYWLTKRHQGQAWGARYTWAVAPTADAGVAFRLQVTL